MIDASRGITNWADNAFPAQHSSATSLNHFIWLSQRQDFSMHPLTLTKMQQGTNAQVIIIISYQQMIIRNIIIAVLLKISMKSTPYQVKLRKLTFKWQSNAKNIVIKCENSQMRYSTEAPGETLKTIVLTARCKHADELHWLHLPRLWRFVYVKF